MPTKPECDQDHLLTIADDYPAQHSTAVAAALIALDEALDALDALDADGPAKAAAVDAIGRGARTLLLGLVSPFGTGDDGTWHAFKNAAGFKTGHHFVPVRVGLPTSSCGVSGTVGGHIPDKGKRSAFFTHCQAAGHDFHTHLVSVPERLVQRFAPELKVEPADRQR